MITFPSQAWSVSAHFLAVPLMSSFKLQLPQTTGWNFAEPIRRTNYVCLFAWLGMTGEFYCQRWALSEEYVRPSFCLSALA